MIPYRTLRSSLRGLLLKSQLCAGGSDSDKQEVRERFYSLANETSTYLICNAADLPLFRHRLHVLFLSLCLPLSISTSLFLSPSLSLSFVRQSYSTVRGIPRSSAPALTRRPIEQNQDCPRTHSSEFAELLAVQMFHDALYVICYYLEKKSLIASRHLVV